MDALITVGHSGPLESIVTGASSGNGFVASDCPLDQATIAHTGCLSSIRTDRVPFILAVCLLFSLRADTYIPLRHSLSANIDPHNEGVLVVNLSGGPNREMIAGSKL